MKKQKTLLIVVLIVAIAMVGLYLAMGIISGQKEETGDDAKAVTMLTELEDVIYVQYKNADGTVTFTKTDDAWKCEENAELELVDGYIEEKVAELGNIKGELVEDAVKADCGLEETVYALTVKTADKEVKLVFGVSEDGYCYAMLDGKSEIYEVSESVITILNMSADSFAEPDGDVYFYLQDVEEDAIDEEADTDDVIDDTVLEDTGAEESIVEESIVEESTVEESATEDVATEE